MAWLFFIRRNKMADVFTWKLGSRIKADAEKVGSELETIGIKKPATVLEYARKHKKSELHKCFEWDDGRAAEQYRIIQAGHIIRSIAIKRETVTDNGDKKITIIRAYENIKDDEFEEGRVYVPVELALSDPEMQEQVVRNIKKGIEELREKGRSYADFIKSPDGFNDGLDNALYAL
jgi:hypothetical protein